MINIDSPIKFDPVKATIEGHPVVERRLSQLHGIFADEDAYDEILKDRNDPLVYHVTSVTPVDGDGQLHYGIGMIMPGRIGQEYFMTRGHFHEWRMAAEIYIGLSGTGLMLLEDENDSTVRLMDLSPDSVVYVPGHTAHRTINTGTKPLTYMGIYPAGAGHDYGVLAKNNFSKVVIAQDDAPVLSDRKDYLRNLAHSQL